MSEGRAYGTFREFYPFYLTEHSRSGTRRLHFAGTLLVLLTLVYAVGSGRWALLWLTPLFGYGFAWVGHFFVERNRPATLRHPWWSLAGDFKMYGLMWRGRLADELARVQGGLSR